MNFPDPFSGGSGSGNRPSPRKELQGPRPPTLKVNKESHKIKKPPVAPANRHPAPPQVGQPPPQQVEDRQPVIIYAVSPKVHHTTVGDFMNLVQRLTGNTTDTTSTSASASTAAYSSADCVSPAARLASIEKLASPSERQREREFTVDNIMDILENIEVGQAPGVLSPAPATLPPISPGFFSPAPVDPFMFGYNMFIPSPSTLFSPPVVSPSFDLFNPFFDF